jgi:hypothetical protein
MQPQDRLLGVDTLLLPLHQMRGCQHKPLMRPQLQ